MTYAFIWSCFSFRCCCCYLFVVSAMSFVSVVSHKSWLAWLNTNAVEYRTRFFFFPSVFPFCFIDFFLICQEVYSLTASLRFNKLNAFFSSTSSLLPPVDSRLKWWKWQVLTIDLHAEQSQSWTGFSCVYFFFLSVADQKQSEKSQRHPQAATNTSGTTLLNDICSTCHMSISNVNWIHDKNLTQSLWR